MLKIPIPGYLYSLRIALEHSIKELAKMKPGIFEDEIKEIHPDQHWLDDLKDKDND